jgi:hypothetical protein
MRPETLRRKLNQAIKVYLHSGNTNKIKPLMPSMKKLHSKCAKQENDYRRGTETYGYGDDCNDTMLYISDRWRCAFRLKWIIDGIENGCLLIAGKGGEV